MTEKQIHETAIRLIEGGREFYNGHWYIARKTSGDLLPCIECPMDSICTQEVSDLCVELDCITCEGWMLILADGKRR